MGSSVSSQRTLGECQLRERILLLRDAVAHIEKHPEQWMREEGKEMAMMHYRFMIRLSQYRDAGNVHPPLLAEAEGLAARATEAVSAAIRWNRAQAPAAPRRP